MAICGLNAMLMVLSVSSLSAAAALAQEDVNDLQGKVDQIFAPYDKSDSPGCALGVMRNGEFLYKKAYGSGSLELNVPLTAQSVFYMASASKQFTAASIVLAAEQGYLSLDDDVRKYLPEIPSYGHIITLREMLHHTSGLRDVLWLLMLAGRNLEDVHSSAELMDMVVRQRNLNYVPGEAYRYSNTNYWLMGLVIQRATGKSLAQFAEENIFKPLEMTHTRFDDNRASVVPGRIPAYKPLDVGFGVDWSTNFDLVGDGGLMSSVDDLQKWDRNFYANKLGKGTLLRELQTPGTLNSGKQIHYALGLEIRSYRGLPTVEHGGSLFGYRTALLRFPEQKFSVICLCNLASASPSVLAERVADIYLSGLLSPEDHPAAVHLDPQPFVGRYRNSQMHSVLDVSSVEDDLSADGERFKPIGSSKFASKWGNTLSFQIESNKRMVLMLAHAMDESAPSRYERIPLLKVPKTTLTQYVAAYTSSELEATYRLILQSGQLALVVNWKTPVTLIPTARDEFQAPDGTSIVFRRDSGGRVDGFDMFNAGRIAQILFIKAASTIP